MTISIGVPEVSTKSALRNLWFQEFTAYTEARNADGSNHISIGFDGVSAEFKPPQYSYEIVNLHAYASSGDTLNKAIALNNSTIDLEIDKLDGGGSGCTIRCTDQWTSTGLRPHNARFNELKCEHLQG